MRLLLHIILFIAIGFTSCQKVIELNLDPEEIKYVIEGIVTNENECRVRITRSLNFYEENNFPAVTGALVTVSDNGINFPLTETAPGVYESSTLTGTPGHVYQLSVQVNGASFTATSTMPSPVTLDTLFIESGPFGQFKFANIIFTDAPTDNNGYRFIQYLNGVKDPAIFIQDDEFTQGQTREVQLDTRIDRQDDPRAIETGDAVMIEMLGLDDKILKYWFQLATNGGTGQGSTIAPANPETNIVGGALGYFSAHTITRRTVIAP